MMIKRMCGSADMSCRQSYAWRNGAEASRVISKTNC